MPLPGSSSAPFVLCFRLLLACLASASCAPHVYAGGSPRVPADAPAAPEAGLAEPRLLFDTTSSELAEQCEVEPATEDNVAAKQAFAKKNECLAAALRGARTSVLARTPEESRPQLAALEAAYDRVVEDVCWLNEEVVWIDFDAGTRDDGTLRGYAWLACQAHARVERTYLLRTMELADATGLMDRVGNVQSIGEAEQRRLESLREKARGPAPRASTPRIKAAEALGPGARTELVRRIDAVLEANRRLARETCAVFPGLGDAFGGAAACEGELAAYYAALGRYSAFESGDDGRS